MKRICVVIINYKTPQLTLDCVESLRRQLDQELDSIVIVDNNSGGKDVSLMRNMIANKMLSHFVCIVESLHNNGFSAGNNIGINYVEAEFYLLANSDTICRPDAISELLKAAEKYPQSGLISPRLEWPDGKPQKSCFRFHSFYSEIINSAGTGVITSLLYKFNVPLDVVNDVTFPEWTSFACILIRNDVFKKIGGLDEGFFMYFEDVDFCHRAKKAKFDVCNWPWAHVIHLRGQSSNVKKNQSRKKRLPDYYYRSRARYFMKIYGRLGFYLTNFCWYGGRMISFARELLSARDRIVPEYQSIDIWKS